MKAKIYSLKEFFFVLFLFIANYSLGQQASCKVRLPAIAGAYSGECKNGLAQGYGVAQGIDHYQGQFREGLPQGEGTYTWADSSVFKGQWSGGLKDGKGRMVIPTSQGDSIITGYWKKDNYVGLQSIPPYRIDKNLGVKRSGFHKISEEGSNVVIKIMINGIVNQEIEGFSIAYDSGEEYKSGSGIGIQSILFPVIIKIRYRTWNQFHTSQYDVLFEFTVFEPGKWEIVLSN